MLMRAGRRPSKGNQMPSNKDVGDAAQSFLITNMGKIIGLGLVYLAGLVTGLFI